MESSTLIIITNYFPYYKGEEYLESELPHLNRNFDRVIIVPTMKTATMTEARALPVGVEVALAEIGLSTISKAKMFFGELLNNRNRWTGTKFSPFQLIRRPIRHLYDCYFEARALASHDVIDAAISRLNPILDGKVILYSYWFYVTARVAIELKENRFSRTNTRLISRGHGYDINTAASSVNYLPQREFLLAKTDALHPVSTAAAKQIASKYPEFAEKVSVRRLGSPEFVTSICACNKNLHVVSCSTVRPLKRLELIIEALEIARSRGYDIHWTHLGSGEPKYMDKIKRMAWKRLSREKVDFVGQLTNKEVQRWYQDHSASVFVNASSSEGVPVSIMEAMCAGLPIIATDVGGTSDLFTKSMFDGLVGADVSGKELADKLTTLFSARPVDYDLLALASRSAWEEGWNADVIYSAFAEELAAQGKLT